MHANTIFFFYQSICHSNVYHFSRKIYHKHCRKNTNSIEIYSKQINKICKRNQVWKIDIDQIYKRKIRQTRFWCAISSLENSIFRNRDRDVVFAKKKNIERFANDYIFEFDNDIRMIVNLNIEYKIDKKTTLFVWRSNIITNEIEKKKLIVQLIVANQICKHHLNLYFMLIRCKFFVISMTIQIHFVQKIFDYVFEISSRKFWSKLIYAIRLSFLSTNYIRFLKTRKMQRSSLNNNLTSSQLINRE